MEVIKQFFNSFLAEKMAAWICGNIRHTMEVIVLQTNSMNADIGMDPRSYNSTVWSIIESITENAVSPIAVLILTAVMLIELISWANTQNNMHTSSEVIGHFIKLFIGIFLVSKSHDITLLVFQMSSYVVSMAGSTLDTEITYNLLSESSIAALQNELALKGADGIAGFSTLLVMLIVSLIGVLGSYVIFVICRVIVIGRIIQIYMYCSIGAIPYASFMNKELSAIGINYIKNLFAIAFQGFFMLVAITIYGYLFASMDFSAYGGVLSTAIGLVGMILEYLCYGFALCFTLIGSKSLAKSIFNAH